MSRARGRVGCARAVTHDRGLGHRRHDLDNERRDVKGSQHGLKLSARTSVRNSATSLAALFPSSAVAPVCTCKEMKENYEVGVRSKEVVSTAQVPDG